jgi:hypothetical protein
MTEVPHGHGSPALATASGRSNPSRSDKSASAGDLGDVGRYDMGAFYGRVLDNWSCRNKTQSAQIEEYGER